MPPKNAKSQSHTHYHKDGTVWAKGELINGIMTGYWEWFRKDGSRMRSGSFVNGEQVDEWTTYANDGRVVKVTTMKPKALKATLAQGKAVKTSAKEVAPVATKKMAKQALKKTRKTK